MSDTMRAKGLSSRTFRARSRSEEHTSELQSQSNLVCRLLLEKKKKHDRCRGCGHPFRAASHRDWGGLGDAVRFNWGLRCWYSVSDIHLRGDEGCSRYHARPRK